jgi:adenylosuccinate synthase
MTAVRNKVDVLLGLQWGDEGKGKIVDVLTPGYNMVARFQGGPNAGHTLEFDHKKFILHTVPSGIFHENSINIIGNGVVIDPVIFRKECTETELPLAILQKRLVISRKAHLILPSHKLLDAALEFSRGESKIGSTLKGIGPTYTDKVARLGIRVGDALTDHFDERYRQLRENHLQKADQLGFDKKKCNLDGLGFDAYEQEWLDAIEFLRRFPVIDSEVFINQALQDDLRILAEGAQGSLLDIDFGSYPFVTSSNTISAGACTGLGIAPSRIGEVLGIVKAYCTRVGSGPFPTELFDNHGEQLRKHGNEFGSTTGRPRRCGWLDLPALKHSIMINGVTALILTKSDVLNHFDQISVCTDYQYKGELIRFLPFENDNIIPVYKHFKGWNTSLEDYTNWEQLPAELHEYINFIEDYVKVPVTIISTGPDRAQTIFRQ